MTSPARYTRFCQIHELVRTLNVDHDLTLALADLDHADPLFLNAAKRMQDARAGLPGAQAYDAPSVSGGGSELTQPERLAEQTDRTQADRILLDSALDRLWMLVRHQGVVIDPEPWRKDITRWCLTLRRLVDTWTPHAASDKQREAMEQANTAATPLCQHCTPHRAKGHAEPVHRTGNAAGNLDAPLGLCHWCYRFVLRTGRLPVKTEIQRNDNGQRVMVKA